MRPLRPPEPEGEDEIPWAIPMRGISTAEPGRLMKALTGAILGCGGWVLNRGRSDSGALNFLFEFERGTCLDIYSMVIAAGVELSRNAHLRFTELCQLASLDPTCAREIVSVDLEIQILP
jgi:hypothetical protein